MFALMLISFAVRVGAYPIPYEGWMGTYIGEKKVGYLRLTIEKAKYNGVDGYKIVTDYTNHLTVLGADMTQVVNSTCYTDLKYAPLREDFSMSSGGKTTQVNATFKQKTIECDISAGSGASTKSIPIPEGASLVADPLFSGNDSVPAVGTNFVLFYFNPLTLSVDQLKIKVDRKEKINVGGKDYDTLVLLNATPMGDMTVWQESDGQIVKITGMMGISMVRMSKEEALAGVGGGSSDDFAVLTSVKPNRVIDHPRDVKSMDVVIDGLTDSKMVISDSRQTANVLKANPGEVQFSIKAEHFNAKKASNLPPSTTYFHDYLVSTPYVDHDVPDVAAQSRAIVESERNPYTACSKIRAWVYGNLKAKADIGITRSASDVLKSKVGVCRDYAILFAALARSAGIPSKVVSGLLYTDGAFYYHAWVECYVGKWMPFDATLPSDFVDATHIKLAEGDATTMFGLAKVIGTLKVDIKDYK